MNKREMLVLLRGMRSKMVILQTLLGNHYINGLFTEDKHERRAHALLDEISDMARTLRNEL